jgi:hypothetical protein
MIDHDDMLPHGEGDLLAEGARDAFVSRIAGPLREPESLDASFDARLMAAVRASAPPVRDASPALRRAGTIDHQRSWWRRPRTLRVSPAAGLLLAAGVASVAFFGGAFTARLTSGGAPRAVVPTLATHAPAPREARDTVHVVRFVLVAPTANSVTLVGDFNNWDRAATRLTPAGATGTWTISLPLAPGRYEYAFIVDGTQWEADPTAPITMHDDFGTTSSVVTVGSRASSRAS